MNLNTKLSVIIPSYMECENLENLLPRLVQTLSRIEPAYEILVVDTAEQMDGTMALCDELQGKIRYLQREGGNNYGDAVRTGISNAVGYWTIFMDADGSHDPEFVEMLYAEREANDVVIASRYVLGGATQNSKVLILMSLAVNLIYSIVLDLNCKDVSNSYKLYVSSQLNQLKLHSQNFDIVEEILFKLKRKKSTLAIRELPFTFKQRMFGKTKRNLLIFAFTYLYTLIKLRFSK